MAARGEAEDLVVYETLNRHGEKIATLEANYSPVSTKADIRQLETKIEKAKGGLNLADSDRHECFDGHFRRCCQTAIAFGRMTPQTPCALVRFSGDRLQFST